MHITKVVKPKHHQLLLIVILAFSFFTRMIRLEVPERYIFDEVYHSVTAHLMADNNPQAFEWWNPPPEPNTAVDWLHPPLAKYTQAFFINIFGYTSFGWRFSSVLFGVGVIWLTYKLTSEVFENEEIGLLAAGLASLDGLLLVQSRIAMNDIHVSFFILLTLWLYWRYRQQFVTSQWLPGTFQKLAIVGLAAGLAMASKWSGLFVLILVGMYEVKDLLTYFLTTIKNPSPNFLPNLIKTKFSLFVCLGILPLVIYIGSYAQMFAQGKSLICEKQQQVQGECYFERFTLTKGGPTIWEGYISHFAMLHRQIWWYQTSLTATHGYQSRPWQWFFNLKPVWFHVDYNFPNPSPSKEVNEQPIANIYAMGNTAIFWLGGSSVIFSLIFLLHDLLNKLWSKKSDQLFFIIFSYGIVWLPWVASPRIMFFYHYTPAVPLLCSALAYWLYQMMKSHNSTTKMLGQLAVLSCIVVFIIWFPQWTALPVPTWFANTIYYAITSWK